MSEKAEFTGVSYYRARYYDPQAGRFLQEDELGFDAGINFYPYVLNNPLNWIDPYGDQQDSVTSLPMQAIRSGNSAEIENILDTAGDVLSEDSKELGREAVKRLRTPAAHRACGCNEWTSESKLIFSSTSK